MNISKSRVAWCATAIIGFAATIPQDLEAATAGAHARPAGDAAIRQAPAVPRDLNFIENWDGYEVGSNVLGQGGWEGFFGNSDLGALVDDTVSTSPANAIEIAGASDIVHRLAIPSGVWVLSAKQYIPAGFSGSTYFNAFKIYQVPWWFSQWSVQVHFDAATASVVNDGASGGELPYVTDEWADIEIRIDLDNDTQTFMYNGAELYTGTWTAEMLGFPGGRQIGAIELFANGSSPVYYDDISLSGTVSYAVALEAATTAASAEPGATVTYTLTATNTGNFDDVYDIAPGPGAWMATASQSELSLDVGESATFDVIVQVPADAVEGDSDFTVPSVTSRGRNETGDAIAFTTTVGDSIFAAGFDP